MLRKKLFTYGLIIGAIVAADFIKFLILGFPTLVNWQSFVHTAWVLTALSLLFAAIWADNALFWRALFKLHAAIAIIALLNHYVPFSSSITYNCMLFNFALASLYFAVGIKKHE